MTKTKNEMIVLDTCEVIEPVVQQEITLFNPYPYLGCPKPVCWPRGFPLKEILNENTWNTTYIQSKSQLQSFGVLQSIADIQPGTVII